MLLWTRVLVLLSDRRHNHVTHQKFSLFFCVIRSFPLIFSLGYIIHTFISCICKYIWPIFTNWIVITAFFEKQIFVLFLSPDKTTILIQKSSFLFTNWKHLVANIRSVSWIKCYSIIIYILWITFADWVHGFDLVVLFSCQTPTVLSLDELFLVFHSFWTLSVLWEASPDLPRFDQDRVSFYRVRP